MSAATPYFARCEHCDFYRSTVTYDDARRAATVHEIVHAGHLVIAWMK